MSNGNKHSGNTRILFSLLLCCVFSVYAISLAMTERIYSLSYYHHQIGSMNYYPLFRVRSWNNGMRCMSLYILMLLEAARIIHSEIKSHFEVVPRCMCRGEYFHWRGIICHGNRKSYQGNCKENITKFALWGLKLPHFVKSQNHKTKLFSSNIFCVNENKKFNQSLVAKPENLKSIVIAEGDPLADIHSKARLWNREAILTAGKNTITVHSGHQSSMRRTCHGSGRNQWSCSTVRKYSKPYLRTFESNPRDLRTMSPYL